MFDYGPMRTSECEFWVAYRGTMDSNAGSAFATRQRQHFVGGVHCDHRGSEMFGQRSGEAASAAAEVQYVHDRTRFTGDAGDHA
jgi:hypothetical protein